MKARSRSAAREGRFASNRQIVTLSLLLLVALALALLSFFHIQRWDGNNARYLLETSEQQILSQRLAKYSLEAAQGDKRSFVLSRQSRDRFQQSMSLLRNGVASEGLPPSPPEVGKKLREAEKAWLALREQVDKILSNEKSILAIRNLVASTTDKIPALQTSSDEVVQLLLTGRASREQIYTATYQLMLAQRIDNNLRGVLAGGGETLTSIDQFSQDTDRFGQVLEAMLAGSQALGIPRVENEDVRRKLEELQSVFTRVSDNAQQLLTLVPDILPGLDAAGKISAVSDETGDALANLVEAYRADPGRLSLFGYKIGPLTVLLLGGLAGLFLVLLGYRLLVDANRREADSKAINEANQKAILRLLDEMGDLADGDLTMTATVTEDITGAIADSINYAIEALRNLVTTINGTSEKVSHAAQESRATAMHLADASELQAQQITQTVGAIKDMTQAIEGMASDATESAEVAQRSVEIAGKGGETVRSTIQGMDTIREQIQETAKRIKRLGESSQEIGDIVELIDDIADQTNILALNAAMQAAMAGEAGRGFAVVADEVQRLAERSSNATKQIEALVKTIQADTNEAVTSMEASTTGVVHGAKLAEDAGDALMEIENVSNYIAELTRKISDSAVDQAREATKVDDSMSVIQEITNQTADGTRQTAASVGTLAELADELQRSVAGFRLPD
jgi:twitching motility protein PilJ